MGEIESSLTPMHLEPENRSLEPQNRSLLEAAKAYLACGMAEEADAEFKKITHFPSPVPQEVLVVWLKIYRTLKGKEVIRAMGPKFFSPEVNPNTPEWWTAYALATRQVESIDTARRVLSIAEELFGWDAIIKYHLACCEAQLGEIEEAKRHLHAAFSIAPAMRAAAMEDSDLQPVWAWMAEK